MERLKTKKLMPFEDLNEINNNRSKFSFKYFPPLKHLYRVDEQIRGFSGVKRVSLVIKSFSINGHVWISIFRKINGPLQAHHEFMFELKVGFFVHVC